VDKRASGQASKWTSEQVDKRASGQASKWTSEQAGLSIYLVV